MRTILIALLCASIVGASLGVDNAASALPIDPGFDLFTTVAPTFVILPGLGTVDLEGRPIDPANLGNTDTIVERKGGLATGGVGDIPIELVALSLQSVNPISLSGTFFDLLVLGGEKLIDRGSPDGTMTILLHDDPLGGGTFTSALPVDVDLIFTEVGNPANRFIQPLVDTLDGSGFWSHTRPQGYPPEGAPLPRNQIFESGDFFPGPGTISEVGRSGNEVHSVVPAQGPTEVPEPSTLLLLGSGLVMLGGYRWKRSRQR